MRQKLQVELTSRDLKILQFTFEQRVVSCKQLAKRFFSTIRFSTAHARLEKLTAAKYMVKSYTVWRRTRTSFYSITEKGIKAFAENYHHQIEKYDYKSDSVNHDLGLVLVRERFERATMLKQYLSESMLQNCSDLYEKEELSSFSLVNSDCCLLMEMPGLKN